MALTDKQKFGILAGMIVIIGLLLLFTPNPSFGGASLISSISTQDDSTNILADPTFDLDQYSAWELSSIDRNYKVTKSETAPTQISTAEESVTLTQVIKDIPKNSINSYLLRGFIASDSEVPVPLTIVGADSGKVQRLSIPLNVDYEDSLSSGEFTDDDSLIISMTLQANTVYSLQGLTVVPQY